MRTPEEVALLSDHQTQEDARLKAKAERLGLTLASVKALEAAEHNARLAAEQATRALTHYLENAGVVLYQDERSDVAHLIESLIEGSVAASQAALLKSNLVRRAW